MPILKTSIPTSKIFFHRFKSLQILIPVLYCTVLHYFEVLYYNTATRHRTWRLSTLSAACVAYLTVSLCWHCRRSTRRNWKREGVARTPSPPPSLPALVRSDRRMNYKSTTNMRVPTGIEGQLSHQHNHSTRQKLHKLALQPEKHGVKELVTAVPLDYWGNWKGYNLLHRRRQHP